MQAINWDYLWDHLSGRFQLDAYSIHGPDHWRRVEQHAITLAEHAGGNIIVARLFAAFHDVCRESDGGDREHGPRAARLVMHLRGEFFDLPDADLALLQFACRYHTSGLHSDDPTIGACWDADRLDIWRAGHTPAERFMSTDYGRLLARTGNYGLKFHPERDS